MCGINGMLSFEADISRWRRSVEQSTRLMERRGPDSSGLWDDGHSCALGFRRLAILDLSPLANQPLLSPEGRYALFFNGEVYNFRELTHQTQGKRGFTASMDRWLRGVLRPVFEEEVLGRREIVGLPVDQQRLGAVFADHLAGRENYKWALWRLLSLALWERHHYRRRRTTPS